MTWFDFFSLFFLSYFVIRGFFRGLLRALFPLLGMLIAFSYSGWLSLKLQGMVSKVVTHPKIILFLSHLLAFFLIYFTFCLAGFVLFSMVSRSALSLVDLFFGALFGFIKGLLFITFFYLLIFLIFPSEKENLERSLTHPLASKTLKTLRWFISKDWIDYLKKIRGVEGLPPELIDSKGPLNG